MCAEVRRSPWYCAVRSDHGPQNRQAIHHSHQLHPRWRSADLLHRKRVVEKCARRCAGHRGIARSDRITGRKTGKQYTIPISYIQDGDLLTCYTASVWWKNVRGGAPVTVVLRGQIGSRAAKPASNTPFPSATSKMAIC